MSVSILALLITTGVAVMKTQARPASIQIPVGATTTISNVEIDLSNPTDPVVRGDVTATITLKDPATGVFIREQQITIPSVDLTNFALASTPASEFFANASAAAQTALQNHGIEITDSIIESITLRQNENGELDGADINVNVAAQLLSDGDSDPVALAILGEFVPDGTVLWETRIRVTLDGNIYTALDPTETTMKSYIANIINNVELVLP